MSDWDSRIARRAALAGINPAPHLIRQCGRFLALLERWNEHINLTALGDPDETTDRLVVEPLAAAPHIPSGSNSLLDIGSGGGSPAIPLKLAVPRLSLVMVERRMRKAAFLREAVRQLELQDARVEKAAFEALADDRSSRSARGQADVVSVRAMRLDRCQLDLVGGLLRPGGRLFWFLREGQEPERGAAFEVEGDHGLVPSRGSRLVVLRKRTGA